MTARRFRPARRRAAPAPHHPPLHEARRRLGADRGRRHEGALHGERRGRRAAVSQGQGPRLAHRRVRDAAARDEHADAGARPPTASSRDARRRSSGSSAAACARSPISRRSASARSRSTATCCRPTAARAARRSPAPASRSPTRSRGAARAVSSQASRCANSSPRYRSAWSAARRCSISTTPRIRRCDTDMNVVMTAGGGFVEVQGTAEGAPFSRARNGRARRRWPSAASAARSRRSGRRSVRDARPGDAIRRCAIPRLVLASSNAGKLREFRRLLAPLGIEVIAQSELGIPRSRRAARHVRRERARQGAARERAREACRRWPTIPASACVRSAARPGVQSARYAGEPKSDARNNAKLIAALARDRRPPRALRVRAGAGAPRRTIPSRSSPRARGTGRSSTRRAAPAASATTRTSSTTDDRPHRRRAAARAQERAVASRQGDARADRKAARRAVSALDNFSCSRMMHARL